MLRSRILFALALAAAAVLAVSYEDTHVGFTLLYALLILCALCALSAALAPKLLAIHESVAQKTVFKGEALCYTLAIHNRGPFPYPSAVYKFHAAGLPEREDSSEYETCGPPDGRSREYTLRYPYRGVYELGLESVTVTDMLGLFTRTIRNKQPLRITVFPERDASFGLAMRNEPQEAIMRRDFFGEDYSTIADLRKYTPADSLRKIHWKLSAKRGELIAKNFQNFEPDKTVLLLDTLAINLPERERTHFEDKMASCAATAVDFFAHAKMPASLVYGQPGLDEATIRGEADGYYALLAGARFERESSALHEMRRVPGRYNMVALLSALDAEMSGALKALVSLGHNVGVYLFHAGRPTREHKQLTEDLRAFGVSVIPIEVGQEQPAPLEEGGAA